MKFIVFNLVVIGALWFLYQRDGEPSELATRAPAAAAVPEASAGPGEEQEMEPAIIGALERRIGELEGSIVALEGQLERALTHPVASASAPAKPAEPIAVARAGIEPKPATSASPVEAVVQAVRVQSFPSEFAQATTPTREAWLDGPDGPKGSAADADRRKRPSKTANEREVEAPRTNVARVGTDAGMPDPGARDPVIDGELMTPAQRRGALIQLAQDMELHFLTSAGK